MEGDGHRRRQRSQQVRDAGHDAPRQHLRRLQPVGDVGAQAAEDLPLPLEVAREPRLDELRMAQRRALHDKAPLLRRHERVDAGDVELAQLVGQHLAAEGDALAQVELAAVLSSHLCDVQQQRRRRRRVDGKSPVVDIRHREV